MSAAVGPASRPTMHSHTSSSSSSSPLYSQQPSTSSSSYHSFSPTSPEASPIVTAAALNAIVAQHKREILLSEAWPVIYRDGICKLTHLLSTGFNSTSASFTNQEYVQLYTLIYNLCIQKQPHHYSNQLHDKFDEQLYDKFDECFVDYLTQHVQPALGLQQTTSSNSVSSASRAMDALSFSSATNYSASPVTLSSTQLMKQVVRRWNDHKIMKRWMVDFFRYLDRFFIKRSAKRSLNDVALARFRSLVFEPIKARLTRAMLESIEEDRLATIAVVTSPKSLASSSSSTSNNSVDYSLLHEITRLYIEMGHTGNSSLVAASISMHAVPNSLPQSRTIGSDAVAASQSLSLRVYLLDFERPMLKAAGKFYAQQALLWLNTLSCSQYFHQVSETIQRERRRVQDYMHASTEQPLVNVLYEALLVNHQQRLLEHPTNGMASLLQSLPTPHSSAAPASSASSLSSPLALSSSLPPSSAGSSALDDLSLIYSLYSHVPACLPSIARILHTHLLDAGSKLMERHAQHLLSAGDSLISDLLMTHEKYFDLVKTQFQAHAAFQKALREAFESVINQPLNASSSASSSSTSPSPSASVDGSSLTLAELLAMYMDSLLKKGGIKLADNELLLRLERCLRLFSYVHDKDLFHEYYRNLLASRLLLQKSNSQEAEKFVISLLKLKCGHSFTNKLEAMINDLALMSGAASQQEWTAFARQHRQQAPEASAIELSAQVLSAGCWPSYASDALTLPPAMDSVLQLYSSFYLNKTSHRKLRWIHELGTVTLTSFFPLARVDVIVSTLQAVILLCFNEEENAQSSSSSSSISIRDLQQRTGLEVETLKAQLKVLVNGKYRLLIKTPVERYSETDMISVNVAFVQPLKAIRLPNGVRKTNRATRDAAQASIKEDRKHIMEANIVRIMKARKQCTHQELMSEVLRQLLPYFEADPRQVKHRIEDLIARDFLERDKEHPGSYRYLA